MEALLKKCSSCRTGKPVEEFAVDKTRADGRYSWCRKCYREYAKTKRAQTKNEAAEYGVKRCGRCKKIRHVTQFTTNKANPDGRYSYCRACARKVRRKRYKKDPEPFKDAAVKRKAKVKGAKVETVTRRKIRERDNGMCQICLLPVTYEDMHLDHVVPISKGGEHSYANTQTTHATCNLSKYNKYEEN